MMKNIHNALLYYVIAEGLFIQLQSWSDKTKLERVNKMIDGNYKLKMLNQISSEDSSDSYIDKIGSFFYKK